MTGLAARNGGKAGVAALLAILAVGLGLRLAEAWDGRPPVYDAQGYAAIAASLERGDGFELGPGGTQPASNYSPGLPLLVAAVYTVGGADERLARVVLALIGSLAVLFAYLLGRRFRGPAAGLLAAAPVAVFPALVEYQGMFMSEPLAATLLAGTVLALLRAADAEAAPPPWPWRWLLAGLLLGALALTRPEYLAISLPIALVVFARGGRAHWRRGLLQAAAVLAGLVLVVAPWTLRNAVALDRFVPISTGGGQVLFAGTYLPSDGDPERVGAEVLERHPELRRSLPAKPRLEQVLAALAGQQRPEQETDEALAGMGREQLWKALTEEPLEYGAFLAAKLFRVWSPGPRRAMEALGWTVLHWVVLGLAALGLGLLAAQRRWEALLLGTVLAAVAVTGALLVASPRRALVTVPLLAALAGLGAAWLAGLVRERRQAGL